MVTTRPEEQAEQMLCGSDCLLARSQLNHSDLSTDVDKLDSAFSQHSDPSYIDQPRLKSN